ncbi:MAG: hypothetical protein ACFFAJ_04110 [Candidatus Hodarchaeota archaeon]
MSSFYSKNDRYIAIIEIFGAMTIIGFWIGWFLDIFKSINPTHPLYDTYVAFETSFPIADAWIVILLLVSAYGIFKEKQYGAPLAIAAGGALVFLGLIDSSFYLQQGVYQDNISLFVINLACFIGGGFAITWFGRNQYQVK